MNFHFPGNDGLRVSHHAIPHTFYNIFRYCDVMETEGAFGRIYQQFDKGEKSEVALHDINFTSTASATMQLDAPAVILNYVFSGRGEASHAQLGSLWQKQNTSSLWYLPAGNHHFNIKKGNCTSIKLKVSLHLIAALGQDNPDIRKFYECAVSLSPNGWRLPYVPTLKDSYRLLQTLTKLKGVGRSREILIDSHVSQLFLQFIDDLRKTKEAPKDNYRYDQDEIAKILAAQDQILHRQLWGVPVPTIALQFGMSPRKFARYFQHAYNMTFQSAITLKRITEACQLLINSELPIGDIALKVKYENHSAFTRTFEKCMGCAPSEYRRHNRLPQEEQAR
ncbi:AraC family transcriptional regulator [Chitinophaga horti]|uniref:AraC family transcriptional regulator n=1 Tax=Chitinophaga horti TaxID=2920382 RepID=A0ABY6JCA6_9BACT|nr:AraC family transcriptional regulator [Chitinophaga horti]UYQ95921.1 AraC family transcriptional regulator [Chitinophaga horti]